MNVLGKVFRTAGCALDAVGRTLQGSEGYVERLVPSARVVPVKGGALSHGVRAMVASSASVIGAVELADQASVFYGAVVRGDKARTVVGKRSSVLDNASVQGAVLGDDVVVGPGCYLDGCTVDSGATIGMGSRVLQGAAIGADSYIAPGAIVAPGTRVPAGEVWAGAPAVFHRKLTVDEMSFLRTNAGQQTALGEQHYKQSILTPEEVKHQDEEMEFRVRRHLEWNEQLPAKDPELEQYERLSQTRDNNGLMRAVEYDEAAEWQRLEKLQNEFAARQEAASQRYLVLSRANELADEYLKLAPADVPMWLAHLSRTEPAVHAELAAALKKADEAKTSADKMLAYEKELGVAIPFGPHHPDAKVDDKAKYEWYIKTTRTV